MVSVPGKINFSTDSWPAVYGSTFSWNGDLITLACGETGLEWPFIKIKVFVACISNWETTFDVEYRVIRIGFPL